MERNLLYPLLTGLLSCMTAIMVGAKYLTLSTETTAFLATTLYFFFLFGYELHLNYRKQPNSALQEIEGTHQAILEKLTLMDEHRHALSAEIESKIARILNKNIELIEMPLDTLRPQNNSPQENSHEAENWSIFDLSNESEGVKKHGLNPSNKTSKMKSQPNAYVQKHAYKNFVMRDVLLESIRHALKTDRIETRLQPIVSLPQRKKRYFEATSQLRGVHNAVIVPEQYIDLAEENALIRIIDNAILMKCIYLARASLKKNLTVGFFLNLSLKTLEDSEFIDSLGEFMEVNQNIVDRLVFCLEARDIENANKDMLKIIQSVGSLGCQFALTHVESFDLDFTLLRDFKVRFLKVKHPVLEAFIREQGLEAVKSLKHKAYIHQVDLIVTHIETEDQFKSCLDFECDFGQGYLFGLPQEIHVQT